ncbi:hypothetical protein PsorP6_003663 [Peronosclerospora sorghi]|uniref:Uncharacterized protein n=1 Tax=Peronosclerospora sorghi TaxID=230839 RepID=A0ACC0VMC1_9STRA|nr:hypothetical protein PsorP6_003663 [Peronosclerospora sorghi]
MVLSFVTADLSTAEPPRACMCATTASPNGRATAGRMAAVVSAVSRAVTKFRLMVAHVGPTETLQNEVKEFQKKDKKDRVSKKEVEAQVEAMENALKERHNRDLKAFETEEENTTTLISHTNEDAESASLATKQSKAQAKAKRKRENKNKQERERRERIDEANENTVSERQIETDMILAQLTRYGLKIKDIPSDGHCMYHAVAYQIKQKSTHC